MKRAHYGNGIVRDRRKLGGGQVVRVAGRARRVASASLFFVQRCALRVARTLAVASTEASASAELR